eukprot:647883-Amphidinium_carterae.1
MALEDGAAGSSRFLEADGHNEGDAKSSDSAQGPTSARSVRRDAHNLDDKLRRPKQTSAGVSRATMCRGVVRTSRGYYAAFAYFRHAQLRAVYRKELADAIADNIVLVTISKL